MKLLYCQDSCMHCLPRGADYDRA